VPPDDLMAVTYMSFWLGDKQKEHKTGDGSVVRCTPLINKGSKVTQVFTRISRYYRWCCISMKIFPSNAHTFSAPAKDKTIMSAP
jgi:hypothetical protein